MTEALFLLYRSVTDPRRIAHNDNEWYGSCDHLLLQETVHTYTYASLLNDQYERAFLAVKTMKKAMDGSKSSSHWWHYNTKIVPNSTLSSPVFVTATFHGKFSQVHQSLCILHHHSLRFLEIVKQMGCRIIYFGFCYSITIQNCAASLTREKSRRISTHIFG